MELKNIIAIVQNSVLEDVEARLRELGVKGISISHIKGYGEHADYFARDWLCSTHSRIEIFACDEEAPGIVSAIIESAHTGLAGDGMVAVLPVEKVFRIKTKSEALPPEI